MTGALQAGGTVIGVMADSLERAALAHDNREALVDQRLVLVSPYDPSAGFNVGHAMQRNKLIYALADAALVVTADFEKGGTWAGAIEQLNRFHFVPVFVQNGAKAGKGNVALLKKGGRPWPEPHDGVELSAALAAAAHAATEEPRQESLSFVVREAAAKPVLANPTGATVGPAPVSQTSGTPAEELLAAVRVIVSRELHQPRTEVEIVKLLSVSKPQVKVWLALLVQEGIIEKLTKPVRYRIAKGAGSLP